MHPHTDNEHGEDAQKYNGSRNQQEARVSESMHASAQAQEQVRVQTKGTSTSMLHAKSTRVALWSIGAVVIALFIFGLGAAVGYHRGVFASRFGENYITNFRSNMGIEGEGPRHGGAAPLNQYGIVGKVIQVNASGSVIFVERSGGSEGWVAVQSSTVIRKDQATITPAQIDPGNLMVVIGSPDGKGQILARFIRVFSETSTTLRQIAPFSQGPPSSRSSLRPPMGQSSSPSAP